MITGNPWCYLQDNCIQQLNIWVISRKPVDKASNICTTGPGFKPETGQSRFGLSSLEWINKNEDQECLGVLCQSDHLTRTYAVWPPRAHGRKGKKPGTSGLAPSWAIAALFYLISMRRSYLSTLRDTNLIRVQIVSWGNRSSYSQLPSTVHPSIEAEAEQTNNDRQFIQSVRD